MKRPPLNIVYFSTAMPAAALGDFLLYAILPSYYPHLGLAPIQVGILLSINRWIRLSTNYTAEYCYRRYPNAHWLIAAFFMGSVVTAVYGLSQMFAILLVARILWGVSFSFIRQAGIMTVVNSGSDARLGERMGYFRGISAIWRTFGLFIGSTCHDLFGFSATLIGLGILSLVAVPLGALSQKNIRGTGDKFLKGASEKKGNVGVICCGFTLGIVGGGMIMSTLGLILKAHVGESFEIKDYTIGVATLTGFVMGLRWLIDGLGSPVLGAAADRIGRQRCIVFLFPLNAMVLVSVSQLAGPTLLIFLIFVFFICSTTLMTLLSIQAGQRGPRAVASYATAIDLGMSIGPMIGWSIAQFGFPANFIFISGGVMYGMGSIIAFKSFSLLTRDQYCS